MSLWYESLGIALYDCGDNLQDRAKCIFSYLSMPVPRSLWEKALNNGNIHDSDALLIHELQMELSMAGYSGEMASSGLLVAMAFIDEESGKSNSHDMRGKKTINDYLGKARKVLLMRPELNQLGRLIDEKKSGSV